MCCTATKQKKAKYVLILLHAEQRTLIFFFSLFELLTLMVMIDIIHSFLHYIRRWWFLCWGNRWRKKSCC
jgi:hypothetical protein